MDNQLIARIQAYMEAHPGDPGAYEDLFALCRNLEGEDFATAHSTNEWLRGVVASAIGRRERVEEFFSLYRKTLLFDAPYFLDPYLLYLEIDREPKDRFYQPRRKILLRVVEQLQALYEDKLDELFLSMPPRVGKTTLLIFLMTWLLGRDSEKANLYSAYSDTITKAYYNGVLEILNDPVTYRWKDVFPNAKLVSTNAADETLNVDRHRHYPSLTCRSLYGTLNGACDCNGFLISDDLIGGIEEAMNKERMVSAWSKVDNNLIPRAKEKAKLLWCGTRWSVYDPPGLRTDILENEASYAHRRWRVINLPALDENDESHFDYDYGVGFSTDYYRQRRASFERNGDMASWLAQYMGQPIEREGTLFAPADLRYYNGVLPDCPPDRVFMAVDPAFGGGDYVASPVCVQYGEDVYIPAVVYDPSDKRVTQALIADLVVKWEVATVQFEANKSTDAYREGVAEILRQRGYRAVLTSKAAPTVKAKSQRIFDKAPDIREHMIFLEDGKRDKMYSLFMQNVFSFKMFAKKQNDDAPDSLAQAAGMMPAPRKIEIFRRVF